MSSTAPPDGHSLHHRGCLSVTWRHWGVFGRAAPAVINVHVRRGRLQDKNSPRCCFWSRVRVAGLDIWPCCARCTSFSRVHTPSLGYLSPRYLRSSSKGSQYAVRSSEGAQPARGFNRINLQYGPLCSAWVRSPWTSMPANASTSEVRLGQRWARPSNIIQRLVRALRLN